MPECKEKSTARSDTLRAFLTQQAGIFAKNTAAMLNANTPCTYAVKRQPEKIFRLLCYGRGNGFFRLLFVGEAA